MRENTDQNNSKYGRFLRSGCVSIMKELGVRVNTFGTYSTRTVTMSILKVDGFYYTEISKLAGWSNELYFALFYGKSIEINFSKTIFD